MKVEMIVDLLTKQQEGSVKLEKAITIIADTAKNNSNSSQEVAAASEEQNASVQEIVSAVSCLATMASELQEVVSKFKVEKAC